jgi:hypothetical protein
MGRTCNKHRRKCIQKLAGGVERKRRVGKRKRKWEDNIKNGLEAMGWENVTGLCEHRNEPWGSIKWRGFAE